VAVSSRVSCGCIISGHIGTALHKHRGLAKGTRRAGCKGGRGVTIIRAPDRPRISALMVREDRRSITRSECELVFSERHHHRDLVPHAVSR